MMKILLSVLSLCLSTMAIQAQTWDCDCDDNDWQTSGICILVSFPDSLIDEVGIDSFETWVPSECFAECWGFTDYVVVECDTTGFDWEWEDDFTDDLNDEWSNYDCDCPEEDLESDGICIEVTVTDSLFEVLGIDSFSSEMFTFQTWVPSECYAVCCGFTLYSIVDCDSIFNDDWNWNDDWDWEDEWDDGCDCDEEAFNSEGLCIEVTLPDSLIDILGGVVLEDATFETWVPSECYATCWGYTDYTIVDCDSLYYDDWEDDWDWEDEWDDGCDCDEEAFNSEGLCIEVTLPDSLVELLGGVLLEGNTFETWVPSECYATCWGYTDYVIIDCDSLYYDDWNDDWDWEDEWDGGCDCDEEAFSSEGLCIEVTLPDSLIDILGGVVLDDATFETWVPSECFATCWGYTDYVIIDCDSLYYDDWNDEWDWEDEWDDGCDCDEEAFNSEGLCIEVTLPDSLIDILGGVVLEDATFETWVPSECFATCWGYTDYTIIDCDSIYNDDWNDEWDWEDEWDDGCDCDEEAFNSEGLCIEVTLPDSLVELLGGVLLEDTTFETWVPSECYATCWGYTDYVIIDCDSIYNDDWNDEWDNGCDCEEIDENDEGICIEVTLPDSLIEILGGINVGGATFETWLPSECFAVCYGYSDYVIIDCDTSGYIGGFEDNYLDSLDVIWNDCGCEFLETDEPVCVLTDPLTGEICPFPNMCYAECLGYTVDDVVDCEVMMSTTCTECLDEEIVPVCVQDNSGNIFPVPNQCFADCLGLATVMEGCGEMVNGALENEDLPLVDPSNQGFTFDTEVNTMIAGYKIYPNPTVESFKVDLDMKESTKITMSISNYNGQLVSQSSYDVVKGINSINVDVNDYAEGLYTINIFGDNLLLSKRFVKQ